MAPGGSRGKSIALLALAVCLGCVALLVLFGRPPAAPPPREPEAPPAAAAAPGETEAPLAAGASEAAAPPVDARAEEPPAPEVPVGEEQAPAAEDAEGESAPTVPSGVGLFPPPGTDPIKVGIVVPEEFDLPEGFLRHYQATDDGQELEPILLFHPDYELLDDAGQPIPLPESRVVPPELAPPGLPIRMLEVPPPREQTGP
jgi:hypothetical protein